MSMLVPIDNADKAILEVLRHPLEEVFGQRTQIGDSIALTRESWNRQCGQHLTSLLLAERAGLPCRLPFRSIQRFNNRAECYSVPCQCLFPPQCSATFRMPKGFISILGISILGIDKVLKQHYTQVPTCEIGSAVQIRLENERQLQKNIKIAILH